MALGGLAAALLVLWIPVGLIEMVVASSGLSESLPAAAPPLGLKARLLLAGFAALMAVGLMGMMRRQDRPAEQERRRLRVQGARKMGFAFSKLTALTRGRAAPVERDAPLLRRADAHPDAPARAPIFASRDFGGADIFARPDAPRRPLVVHPEPEQNAIVPSAGLVMPSAPLPIAEEELPQPTFLRPAAPLVEPDVEDEAPQDAAPITPPPLDPIPTQGLSITELTQRLERGLALRSRTPAAETGVVRVIADMPVTPAVPVRDTVAQDADDALRAALGALRSMAGRGR
ncbi:hypothetical protein D0Z70_07150 [Sphingobium terrigena]|uniref:Uncharacterized protein n=1 Tax=Sphingobium terrigena TaxID=2304063 RepID=A0A418YUG2_9SPHN|nr:hypothetical protein [Sphingobium terrigena]RJG55814.1 hypothetical protein D0Z70_07150 [Sphingobium terrigena]